MKCEKTISVAATDYFAQTNTTITFHQREVRLCISVRVKDDCVLEEEERFNIMLRPGHDLDRRISINPRNAAIVITDFDGIYNNSVIIF